MVVHLRREDPGVVVEAYAVHVIREKPSQSSYTLFFKAVSDEGSRCALAVH